jgi:hypothetical protein
MVEKVKVKLDGQDYEETQSLEQLINWSNSRWAAGQHEAALNVQKRAEALARVTLKGRKHTLERNDEGVLELQLGAEEEKKAEEKGNG